MVIWEGTTTIGGEADLSTVPAVVYHSHIRVADGADTTIPTRIEHNGMMEIMRIRWLKRAHQVPPLLVRKMKTDGLSLISRWSDWKFLISRGVGVWWATLMNKSKLKTMTGRLLR